MCQCNDCQGTGWLTSLRMYGPPDYGPDEEQEPCRCNPEIEAWEVHSDKDCILDVTRGP